jgi:DNA-binding CsgD family transcriptional regulator
MRIPSSFGRERELGIIDGLLDRARQRGAALLLVGPPGIGKSFLLAAAHAAAAGQGIQVLTTTGVQSEARLPFAGLHQLLGPVLPRVDNLPGPQRDAMRAAFGMSRTAAPDLFLIALAALNLMAEAAAGSPVLLLADDIQWLDRPSCAVLAFVARRLESEPIILLAAGQPEMEHPLREAGLAELAVAGLGAQASRALLEASSGGLTTAAAERVLAAAAGNPLALVELPVALRAGPAGGGTLLPDVLPLSTRLEKAFATKALGLPEVTRTLLLIAAVDDGDALAEVLAAGRRCGLEVTLGALEPAVAAQLVRIDEGTIVFRHPLVRSATYLEATIPQRQAAHAALAGVLADQPDRRAWHRAASITGPDEGVAAELDQAAARARDRGAIGVAVAAQERAATLTSDLALRGRRLLRAAELAHDLGRGDIVDRLVQEAQPLGLAPLERIRLEWLRDTIYPAAPGDPVRLRELVGLADQAREGGDSDLALNIVGSAAYKCYFGAHGPQTRHLVVAAAERIPVPADDPRLLSVLAFADPVGQGAAVFDRLSRLAPQAGADPGALHLAGIAATMVGDFDSAAMLLAAVTTRLREQGRLGVLAQALAAQAWVAAQLVNWSVAVPAAEESARLGAETRQPLIVATGQLAGALLAGLRGDQDAAGALTSSIEQAMRPAGGGAVLAMVQLARGLTALGHERYPEAYAQLRRMFDPADVAYHHMQRWWGIGELAEAAARTGHRDQARVHLEELEHTAGQTPAQWLHVGLLYARPLLADDQDAEELFLAALAADTARWPFFRARIQLAYGSWLRHQRRIAESRAPLRAARDAFDALGTSPWAQRAREELRAAGETSAQRALRARDRLSPQELQIAEMVASGLSNREIGQQLYLSHRTISTHLYHIFPKLGISSRSQMPIALGDSTAWLS